MSFYPKIPGTPVPWRHNLRGDESQYEAWLEGLSPKERKEHEAKMKASAERVYKTSIGPLKIGRVLGICKKCSAPVFVDDDHSKCGGELYPTHR